MLDTASGYEALLMKDLAKWRDSVSRLNMDITSKTKERDDLAKKIAAAETLLGGQKDDAGAESDLASLRNAIKELMEDGIVRKPRHIRRDLIARGIDPKRISSTSGNFYNAIARLSNDGVLMRDAESRYWDPKKSSGPTSSLMEGILK
jgi:chorismate mutase